jgi:NAD(P)-dependent dehydrogenase (short-subunit alcohol dehydrogenase family)
MSTLFEKMKLNGRVAIVTGSLGGIGRAICDGLAGIGCDLALVDRDAHQLDKYAYALSERYNINASGYCIDLEVESERMLLKDQVNRDFSRLDILINNAAFVGDSQLQGWAVPFEDQGIETWRRALEVNLTACFHLIQLFAGMLRQNQVGSIVNIASIYGVVGPDMGLYEGTTMANPAGYAASKGGLVQLTRWMSTVLAPEIRVNSVSPGGIFRNQPKAFVDRYTARTPMGRMANEGDLPGVVAFLAGDLSTYMTGQNLMIDGGWTAW